MMRWTWAIFLILLAIASALALAAFYIAMFVFPLIYSILSSI